MIEDFQPFNCERNKKKVLNATMNGPKEQALNASSPVPTAGAYAPTADPDPPTILPTPPQNVEPINDSMDSPYSNELFDW